MNDRSTITANSEVKVFDYYPVVISASRLTDIPAFYANWFINRLHEGYAVRYNPFNRNQKMKVFFRDTKVVVFWTKNPKPLIPYLKELDDRGIHYYFQFTLNDYEAEGFEPNVPPLQNRLETFKTLSDLIGKDKVIWRFDPLIVSPTLTPRDLLTKIWTVGKLLKGYTEKLVFSFVDVNTYRRVQNNLVKETNLYSKVEVEKAELNDTQITEIAEGLVKIRDRWKSEGWDISLATCAEKFDLQKYGIEHNHCIDGALMKRIFKEDKELLYYLNYGKLPEKNLLFDVDLQIPQKPVDMRDKGQLQNREFCGCMISKDIGMDNTCSHNCVYCYANTSKEAVNKNRALHQDDSENI